MKNKFINTDKKGTIILTHYRSGGTQLRHIIHSFLNVNNIATDNYGEVPLELEDANFYDEMFNLFFNYYEKEYRIIQLNNPLLISFLYQCSLYSKLEENYHIIYLEREDHSKSLLSLPLWEKFIKDGYNDLDEWDANSMNAFHKKYIDNPIKYTELYTGLHSQYNPISPVSYTNYILMTYVNILAKNRLIANNLKLDFFKYEDYEEYNEDFFVTNFETNDTQFLKEVQDSYLQKIPYVSSNYAIYFDQTVKDALSNWKL